MFYSKGLLDLGLVPEVHFEGAGNLIGLDLHLTRERMRELFRTLEEKEAHLQLLERFLRSAMAKSRFRSAWPMSIPAWASYP